MTLRARAATALLASLALTLAPILGHRAAPGRPLVGGGVAA